MDTFKKSLERESGFTLVEMMIVVAIIGLLSSVAIPNFQKFQARSKSSEAKLQLAAVYTSEAFFFSQFGIYHTCLGYMGYDPEEEKPSRYFSVGFNVVGAVETNAYESAMNSGVTNILLQCPNNLAAATAGNSYFAAGKRLGASISDSTHLTKTAFGDQAGVATMTFSAGAVGVINKDFAQPTNSSYMSINQIKAIMIIRSGY
jgi:type IV pilus assembly protein PilA